MQAKATISHQSNGNTKQNGMSGMFLAFLSATSQRPGMIPAPVIAQSAGRSLVLLECIALHYVLSMVKLNYITDTDGIMPCFYVCLFSWIFSYVHKALSDEQ